MERINTKRISLNYALTIIGSQTLALGGWVWLNQGFLAMHIRPRIYLISAATPPDMQEKYRVEKVLRD